MWPLFDPDDSFDDVLNAGEWCFTQGFGGSEIREEVGLREKKPMAIRPVSNAVRTMGIPQ
ncbi:MAG TPA: hypothetical protein VKX49_12790 [Bryobacteraceae bacterium]|nr:hypothetical protein [Bryobacteraceae bacterium]